VEREGRRCNSATALSGTDNKVCKCRTAFILLQAAHAEKARSHTIIDPNCLFLLGSENPLRNFRKNLCPQISLGGRWRATAYNSKIPRILNNIPVFPKKLYRNECVECLFLRTPGPAPSISLSLFLSLSLPPPPPLTANLTTLHSIRACCLLPAFFLQECHCLFARPLPVVS